MKKIKKVLTFKEAFKEIVNDKIYVIILWIFLLIGAPMGFYTNKVLQFSLASLGMIILSTLEWSILEMFFHKESSENTKKHELKK